MTSQLLKGEKSGDLVQKRKMRRKLLSLPLTSKTKGEDIGNKRGKKGPGLGKGTGAT